MSEAFSNPEILNPENEETDPNVLFSSLKKKKKKKTTENESLPKDNMIEQDMKHLTLQDDETQDLKFDQGIFWLFYYFEMEDQDMDQLFLNKKKKKKGVVLENKEFVDPIHGDEAIQGDDEEKDTLQEEFTGKKKRKKKTDLELIDSVTHSPAGSESKSNDDYTYAELLARFFKTIKEHNPEFAGDKKKYTIVPPQVIREGSKKTAFTNFYDICKRLRRPTDHVLQYLFTEMGTSGSVDGNQRLIIKGRFQQKQVENLLKKYIVEYVTCKTCKSADTNLARENRLFFVQCESCGSTRTVSAIKTGFLAQTTKRAAQRSAA